LEHLPPLKDIPFLEAPRDWQAPFVPEPGGEWAKWPRLTDLFPWQHSGVEFKRTWPIGPTREALRVRWDRLLRAPLEEKPRLFREERDRKVNRAYPGIQSSVRLPPLESLSPGEPPEAIARYGYRSFDRAWAIADGRVCSYSRPPLWRAWSEKQVYLTSLLTSRLGKGPALVATAYVPDRHHFRGSFGGKDVIPLFRDREARNPNLAEGLLELLESTYGYGFPVTSEDFAAYVYALLAQPAYTERFAEELRTPGPRVPLTKDPGLFREGVELGSYLLWLHTYGERYAQGRSWPPKGKARWAKPPSAYPEGHSYDPEAKTLRVGDGEVKDVTPEVYEFEVSGFFPVKSWLGFRQRRKA
ncbi:type ISP restriction/modification enzyme, partial [Fervidobacterium sp.]